MPDRPAHRYIDKFAAKSLGGLTRQELFWLAAPWAHITLLTARRAEMILSRVRLVTVAFAVLTPLWGVLDYATFSHELWLKLAVGRLVATLGLVALLFYLRGRSQMNDAHRAIWVLFAIPTVFYLYSAIFLEQHVLTGFPQALAATHTFLPVLLVAGMSIFPLTIVESVSLAAPVLVAKAWASLMHWPASDWPSIAGAFWLLLLIMTVAVFSSASQLAFIIVLVRQTIRDPLTGSFSRPGGEELLELQFIIAARSGAPLALAFIDLDHFKQVNDDYGHEAGDGVLRQTVDTIAGGLRTGDILARWGGEEFLLIMPNTDCVQAQVALERLRAAGLGTRPDGMPQTVSVGVAERTADDAANWKALVDLADARMYRAKQAGRDRIFACGS